MSITATPTLPIGPIPLNALAGPVPPHLPKKDWNGLLLLGEAPGRHEAINSEPFTGPAGHLLDSLLSELGIERDATLITNAFLHQPVWTPLDNGTRKNNDILQFFTKDTEQANTRIHDGATFRGHYVKETNAGDLRYVWKLIAMADPKVIVSMGATALWLLTGQDKIGENRGTLTETPISQYSVVIPTFHPAHALHKASDPEIIGRLRDDLTLAKTYL
ncbi:uracil-DNA glycosylase family protein [Microvirga tunisiensis]|uniref:Uracil-DNA glycosylase-like domain-containing protein n=1 Tax=Microvirga tunisiensis TaxID=2108360 RepID=A0A5N7MAZ6_9HYPH|nr:uracil-DNA glycosylase family protein [Microvirga tunisiensis]MPR05658.1 hypothetical protein [Microvirga tunisiensis]MPR23858.1 hypothetical protein [Microvirga tunisiensis]